MKDTDINRLKRDLRDAELVLFGTATVYITRAVGGSYTIPDDLRLKLRDFVLDYIKNKIAECEKEVEPT